MSPLPVTIHNTIHHKHHIFKFSNSGRGFGEGGENQEEEIECLSARFEVPLVDRCFNTIFQRYEWNKK